MSVCVPACARAAPARPASRLPSVACSAELSLSLSLSLARLLSCAESRLQPECLEPLEQASASPRPHSPLQGPAVSRLALRCAAHAPRDALCLRHARCGLSDFRAACCAGTSAARAPPSTTGVALANTAKAVTVRRRGTTTSQIASRSKAARRGGLGATTSSCLRRTKWRLARAPGQAKLRPLPGHSVVVRRSPVSIVLASSCSCACGY